MNQTQSLFAAVLALIEKALPITKAVAEWMRDRLNELLRIIDAAEAYFAARHEGATAT